MPRWTADEDFSAVAPGSFDNYDGPTPPPGTYRFKLKSGRLKVNRNGDNMMMLIFEIAEPKGTKKAQYNGAALFWNGNYTKQGAGFLNAMAGAVGFPVRALYTALVLEEGEIDATGVTIKKIGSKSVGGQIVNIKVSHRPYNGEQRLNAQTFFPVAGAADEDDEDGYDESEDEDYEDDSEDYDDEGDEDEDEDEEEPPPPPKKRPAKTAASKRRRPAPEPEEDDEDEDDDEDDAGF